ncbi:Hypothetical predicted protein [Podarcis lilfordi]|uniref:Uncharacterized protein n=1 Tax=Podarcis lilfordi TaxID=74358 RepID=A0AA35PRX5_9SAUR|nr:Hypothetical predicted protein [Podarcis lilfordi]
MAESGAPPPPARAGILDGGSGSGDGALRGSAVGDGGGAVHCALRAHGTKLWRGAHGQARQIAPRRGRNTVVAFQPRGRAGSRLLLPDLSVPGRIPFQPARRGCASRSAVGTATSAGSCATLHGAGVAEPSCCPPTPAGTALSSMTRS